MILNANYMKKKILIVEDDPFTQKLYNSFFAKEGFEVKIAPAIDETKTAANEMKPDLVIVDIILQGDDGFSVIKWLRSQPDYQKTPIIVLSNLGQDADINQAMKLGADKYIVKNKMRLQEISEVIREFIK